MLAFHLVCKAQKKVNRASVPWVPPAGIVVHLPLVAGAVLPLLFIPV